MIRRRAGGAVLPSDQEGRGVGADAGRQSVTGKIELGQPEWEYRPYTQLLPLVDDLIRRGNRLARTGERGEAFFGNQDGYNAYLAEPLDIEYLRATYDLPGFVYDPAEDSLFDSRNWVTIYGSDAGHRR
jgi:hypothetical protein